MEINKKPGLSHFIYCPFFLVKAAQDLMNEFSAVPLKDIIGGGYA